MMESEKFFEDAFKGYKIPPSLRKAVTQLVNAYNINGICDPLYIANVIAHETGKGDGRGNFWGWD